MSSTGNNRELIIEIIDIFILQAIEIGNELQELNDKRDFEALGKLAHKAKSSVAIMGMNKLSEKLRELELLVNEGKNHSEYPMYIDLFKKECAEAIQELNNYKNNL